MARLFISHSSRDNHIAIAFKQWLGEHGWGGEDVFLDLHGLGAGERWKDALKAANARCEAVVFLASPEALASRECGVERRLAEDYGKPILIAIARDLDVDDPRFEGRDRDRQIVSLAAPGEAWETIITYGGESRPVRLQLAALQSIKASLENLGIAPESYLWPPKDRPHAEVFPGLAAFGEDEAAIFFGREADITQGMDKLRLLRRQGRSRVVAIQAASGAGKSSFLRAGLWPRLSRDPDFEPLPILRPAGGIVTGDDGLAAALVTSLGRRGQKINRGDFGKSLTDDAAAMERLIRHVSDLALAERRIGQPDCARPAVMIGIDQAEELFAKADAIESERFLSSLQAVLQPGQDDFQVFVVLTIRADSVDPLLQEMTALKMERAEAFNLGPMPSTSYRRVIEGPIAQTQKTSQPLRIEPALVEALVKDAEGADALPLLAFTLQRLQKDYGGDGKLELAEYDALGRVAGSIRRALEDARRDAGSAGEDEAVRRLFIPMLATWDGEASEPKRLIANRSALLAGDRRSLEPLLHALVKRRLLTEGQQTVEVAHEALLRQEPLRSWLAASKDALRLRDDLLKESQAWGTGGQASKDLVRRGERLKDALELAKDEDFGVSLQACGDYLEACQAEEARERDRMRRIIGRGFVKPIEQAAAEGRHDAALRLAAAGAILSEDPDMTHVPELWRASARSAFENRVRSIYHGHKVSVTTAAFSPDGTRIVTGSEDATARIWDAASGAEIARLKGHENWVTTAAFSPDGTRIVTASRDETARIWDAASGAEIARLKGHENWVTTAAFSPDGTRIVTGSNDNTARIWDAASGAEIACLKGHNASVAAAAFSPDGTRIVTGSNDKTARIWDAASGAEIARLKGHENWVTTAAFSPDGTRIVTGSDDNTARIWDAASTSAIKLGAHALLAGGISFGVGKRTRQEASDILMQDAPEDMFAVLCELPDKDRLKLDPGDLAKATALLRAGKHPNCYRPTDRSSPEVATRSTRRFPVIAVLITLIVLLGGLAAAATVWGPGVGFTALSDLLDPR